MLEIASALSYSKYDNINNCSTTRLMWEALAHIYGGDTNVLGEKFESLTGNFDEMRMQEDETIA